MKFLVGNQLPPALARFISEDLRAEALHVADAGLRDGTDADIWSYASENDFVLISKDDDFVTVYSRTPRQGCYGYESGIAGAPACWKFSSGNGREFWCDWSRASDSSSFADGAVLPKPGSARVSIFPRLRVPPNYRAE